MNFRAGTGSGASFFLHEGQDFQVWWGVGLWSLHVLRVARSDITDQTSERQWNHREPSFRLEYEQQIHFVAAILNF